MRGLLKGERRTAVHGDYIRDKGGLMKRRWCEKCRFDHRQNHVHFVMVVQSCLEKFH